MEVTNINGHIRFCAWEPYNGARRHYLCSHREYCCALGCCVSTAFSLYQLWYFWLLLLLIILLCSGGGWWFRFRHGAFNSHHSPTNTRSRRHGRRGRGHAGGPRVYPNQHQYYGHHSLPPGFDKDPPSYNEVISHLNQFPRIEDVRRMQDGNASTSTARAEQVPLQLVDRQLGVPPPPYEMVLDLKRRDVQLTREIRDLEAAEARDRPDASPGEGEEEGDNSTQSTIRNLLGRIRPRRSILNMMQARQEGSAQSSASTSSDATSSSASSSSSATSPSSGLFTISRESLPMQDYYAQEPVPSSSATQQPQDGMAGQYPVGQTLDSDSSSHSDYSSLLVSSLSSSRRSLVTSPPQPAMELVATSPLEGEMISPEPQEAARGTEVVGSERPCTGRSVLSRPTTSISTHTLPAPEEVIRKTSLPGALVEQEDDRAVEAR